MFSLRDGFAAALRHEAAEERKASPGSGHLRFGFRQRKSRAAGMYLLHGRGKDAPDLPRRRKSNVVLSGWEKEKQVCAANGVSCWKRKRAMPAQRHPWLCRGCAILPPEARCRRECPFPPARFERIGARYEGARPLHGRECNSGRGPATGRL